MNRKNFLQNDPPYQHIPLIQMQTNYSHNWLLCWYPQSDNFLPIMFKHSCPVHVQCVHVLSFGLIKFFKMRGGIRDIQIFMANELLKKISLFLLVTKIMFDLAKRDLLHSSLYPQRVPLAQVTPTFNKFFKKRLYTFFSFFCLLEASFHVGLWCGRSIRSSQ